MPSRATLTIKSRPRADGTVRWFLWIRRPRPERDEFVNVEGYTSLADRPAVEEFAKPYREALAQGLSKPKPETADGWFKRYTAYQKSCGHTDPTKATRWDKWISPRIGTKTMLDVTREHIEDIRDALDDAIRAGDITGKTSMNVWSCLTSSFKAAVSSKQRDLRAIKVNPCTDVEPPGTRANRKTRRKTFLYPKEVAVLLACTAVPREWREVYAIAGYTYLRPGELRVLTWGDVGESINVTKAWDYTEECVKEPKTSNGVRRVPIEPSLAPLLERMRKGRGEDDLVVPLLSKNEDVTADNRRATVDHLATLFREHLRKAGIVRTELHKTTKTHVQANFRSWRDSGLTWLAVSGLGVDKIMRRAGHDTVQTTMGYVKQAEDLTGDLGVPFGPLPEALIGDPKDGGDGNSNGSSGPCEPDVTCEPSPSVSSENDSGFQKAIEREKGFEPSTSTLARWHSTTELLPQPPRLAT